MTSLFLLPFFICSIFLKHILIKKFKGAIIFFILFTLFFYLIRYNIKNYEIMEEN